MADFILTRQVTRILLGQKVIAADIDAAAATDFAPGIDRMSQTLDL
jgi:hypothetical protein